MKYVTKKSMIISDVRGRNFNASIVKGEVFEDYEELTNNEFQGLVNYDQYKSIQIYKEDIDMYFTVKD